MTTPVSGPGQFSQRTDKAVSAANNTLPNAGYGENADYQDLKSSAPMANSGQIAQSFSSLFGNPSASVIGLGADSTMPDVPVTDGATVGPGRGVEALSSGQSNNDANARMSAYLVALEFIANQPGSSDSARNLIRQIKGTM